jgi:AcrR family transcriptional regulator
MAKINRSRERILAAASELFARDGVRASGVNAIIAASGVAKATFYRHFASKDEVVAAWLQRTVNERLTDLQETATGYGGGPSATPEVRAQRFIDAVADRIGDADFPGFPFIDAAIDLRDGPSAVRTMVEHSLAETRVALRDLAASAGVPDPDATATALQLIVLGLLVRLRAEPDSQAEAANAARDAATSLLRQELHGGKT